MVDFRTIFVAVLTLLQSVGVRCHGRLWEPPSRSSMWRQGYNTSVNINDNELNCGGFQNQWISYGGLCGTCGDPFQQRPRDNEAGGKYASGLITRLYRSGETIPITIDLTANHGGYFEFRLCPVEKRRVRATRECFDKHPLVITNQLKPDIKYWIEDRGMQGHVNLEVKLPPLLSCKHCVLQWRWWTASRWACEADVCGKGQGPQEEFYGCSDIAIAPPNQYTAYLPLVTPPTESSPVAYGVSSTNHDHWHHHDGHMKVVIRELHVPDSAEQSLRSKLPGPSFQRPRPKLLGPPNNMPEAKVFFTAQGLSDRQAVKHNLNNVLQRIMLDAYRKYDQLSGQKGNTLVSDRECVPTARFTDNPIILEWCIRGCPGLYNNECPPNMCSCKHNFKQNNEVLIPFMDLALYKSELRNKVPFELTNSFSGLKMYDGLVGNSLTEGLLLGRFGTNNGNSIRNSFPKHIGDGNRFRNGKSDIWNIWKSSPYNKRVDTRKELIRFPIKARSISQIYKQPARTYTRHREFQTSDIKSKIPLPKTPLPKTPLPHIQLPLESIQRFVPKTLAVGGLKFFSKQRGQKVPSIFGGKNVAKYTSSPSVRREIGSARVQRKLHVVPFKLTAKREFLQNESEVMPRKIRCTASTSFGHVNSMIKWCQKNCSFGFCPPSVCKCY